VQSIIGGDGHKVTAAGNQRMITLENRSIWVWDRFKALGKFKKVESGRSGIDIDQHSHGNANRSGSVAHPRIRLRQPEVRLSRCLKAVESFFKKRQVDNSVCFSSGRRVIGADRIVAIVVR